MVLKCLINNIPHVSLLKILINHSDKVNALVGYQKKSCFFNKLDCKQSRTSNLTITYSQNLVFIIS